MASAPLYALRAAEVFKALQSSPDGLAPEEVQARLALYGPNILYEPMHVPLWRRFTAHVTHPMALLLWGAGAAAALIGQPMLGLVIAQVVLVNAAFSFWQEYRAERAVKALRHVLPAHTRVIRAGQELQVPSSEIVPGDVLVLAEGDNIPADARVVEEYGLRANHATLTGDAMPVRKTSEASLGNGLTELERPNLVFAGTSVVSGTGRAVVLATGMLAQFGRIAQLTQTVREGPSSLQQDIMRVTRKIALAAIGAGVIAFIVGMTDVGMRWTQALIFAIGLVVAIAPEGLLPTVTLSLAMAVQRLAQRGVLVKKLAVVETLGKTSVICTDKSGTLTQNQMTVCELWVGGQRLSVSGVGYEPEGAFLPAWASALVQNDLDTLLTAAALCNNSRLTPPSPERPQWTCLGDQTEAALKVAALKGRLDEQTLSQAYPRVHELPFDARRKRMSTIHRNGQGEITFVKGAPKEVLQLCTHILVHGQVQALDHAMRAEIIAANDDYACKALRVLALARRELPPRDGAYTPEKIEQNLTFLGLAAMMDPPRPKVAEAIKTCCAAGIRMVMVTGDYGLTAESVARRVGMLATSRPRILTGADVEVMTRSELQAALDEEIIFARMAPEHKLQLVAAFQARGEVVAVTGDGVNDAPALRKADIGIAMGRSGTDVSKEAADVILTDDSFAAIVSAVEEGRAVYDNIRKFMAYILVSNVPEILPFVLAAVWRLPLALTVPQILAIDLGTDLFPALALGAEKPEPDVMNRPPRRGYSLLGRVWARALWLGSIEAVLCYIGFFWVYYGMGYTDVFNLPRADLLPFAERLTAVGGPAYILATTVFHAGVITAQIGNAFACRRETWGTRPPGWGSLRAALGNRFLWGGIAIEIAVIAALIYLAPLARIFEHRPLPPVYWIGLGLYAPALYGLDALRKCVIWCKSERGKSRMA